MRDVWVANLGLSMPLERKVLFRAPLATEKGSRREVDSRTMPLSEIGKQEAATGFSPVNISPESRQGSRAACTIA